MGLICRFQMKKLSFFNGFRCLHHLDTGRLSFVPRGRTVHFAFPAAVRDEEIEGGSAQER